METLTVELIKEKGWLVFEAIVGSRAYGLDTIKSDTDIRGVFVMPKDLFYAMNYWPQVANASNDIVYYELKRFMELLSKNNPNIMELLNLPDECVLYRHEIMENIQPGIFLSKLCENTFANYALTQVKKAHGLEKKIVNPVEYERKSVTDFCFVYCGKEAIPLKEFLSAKGYKQEEMGLTAITHLQDCYNLYYSAGKVYLGLVKREDSNDVCLSSIPKGESPVGLLYFNRDGYSIYCKRYREYWDWVAKRNDERYTTTMAHGKKYDSKNMMHVFRLLFMAREIATEGKINVLRNDREFLLDIRQGKYEYEDLVTKAEGLKNELTNLYAKANLKEEPDLEGLNQLLVEMRESYYSGK